MSCLIFSCSKDHPEVGSTDPIKTKPTNSLVIGLGKNNGFTILSKIAEKIGLAEILESQGPVTLFAPADTCWTAYLKRMGQNSIDDLSKEQLTSIMQYHIVKGKLNKEELYKKYAIQDPDGSDTYISSVHSTLAKGTHGAFLSLFLYEKDNKVYINSNYEKADTVTIDPIEVLDQAKITDMGDDGQMVQTSKVLSPLSMQEFVLADRINNSDLIKQFGDVNLTFLNQLIKTESLPITLFMPHRTSGAKYDLIVSLVGKFLANKDKYFGYLSIPKNVITTDQFKGQDIATAYNGEKISLKDSKTVMDINGTGANIIVPDIVCTNGVIHYVDAIMAYKGAALAVK